MNNFACLFLLLGLLVGCSQKYNIHDPLPTYWQVKYNEKNYNDVEKQLGDKLNKIDNEIDKLKSKDWNTNVHGIYANIQNIRGQKVIPMDTIELDDF